MLNKQKALLSVLGLMLATGLQLPVRAETLDLLRQIPLDVSAYPSAASIPTTLTTAEQVMKVVEAEPNLLIHMELLRRGNAELPATEREKLLTQLHARHRASENDAAKFFDHGYAQLVFKHNKTGLFYLRKANDRIKNQFTSLAYAMAQAEVDLDQEQSTPDVLTTRKMDVVYKLKDALQYDKDSHQPGFWPIFVRVVQKLHAMPAYEDFADNDFSTYYVPIGSSSPAGATAVNYLASAEHTAPGQSCEPSLLRPEERPDMAALVSNAQIDFDNSGQVKLLQLFKRSSDPDFTVLVTDAATQRVYANFHSPVGPYLVEDLEGDGRFELVIRQYQLDPFHPVIVYRLHDCGFKVDETVETYFR